MSVLLNGETLDLPKLDLIANGLAVHLCDKGLAKMSAAREVIDQVIATKDPVYGVTTGLGPRVVDLLADDSIDSFSLNTIRGRAHGVGNPLKRQWVRAGMAVRANTLLTGAAGARPALAQHICSCLNADVVPSIPESGTIGVADLTWGGALGLALIGEGEIIDNEGNTSSSKQAMQQAGIEPFQPQPREGLALVSHSCLTAGVTAMGWFQVQRCLEAAQTTAALSMEAFRANLSQLDPSVLALRPQPGQLQAADGLRKRLQGSVLFCQNEARRLQDPLSLRNVAQVHGAVYAAMDAVAEALQYELNGASDNPAVVVESGKVISNGGYLPPHLCITLVAASQSMVHLAALQVSRMSKLLFKRFSALPNGLSFVGADGAGLAPLLKPAEALFAEVAHLATPPAIYPGMSADGLEDVQTHTAIPARSLFEIATRLRQLAAIEAIIAAQAIDLRKLHNLPPALHTVYTVVREVSGQVRQDRPLGIEIDMLAARIETGAFNL